ncbi:bifunctional tetrahydrofolate synthase/dihydrofolate synthase [Serpentinimonas barnesii]|uniref:bifunctional tetrahydrofolate synthase/dihydrofolate synthase n=1 Tax=Serpentinimonas barnesii TaxID=1458427 RepID=UPI0005EF87A8|nr:bifunctional tetrahydrofolate synthase/dihydrofolate synthase [Serpentinimonas barnesii]
MTDSQLSPPIPQPATLEGWLAHCERLHPKGIDMGLERVRAVLQRMNGGRGIVLPCPLITVAGTNGKGSTCAMLESIYRHAGYRTGLYTSPHLVRFEERAQVRGEPVQAAVLAAAFAEVERARLGRGGQPELTLTYFEFSTLAIVQALVAAQPEVLVLEIGMGGRLDAVNLWDADCAIITSIDLDHMEFLGPNREAIGIEKAGVMRSGRPVVVSDPLPPQSVLARAHEIGAEPCRIGVDFQFSGDRQQWNWSGRSKRYSGLAYPALRGANQLQNAAGALAAIEALHPRLPVTAQAVRNGLALVQWPGRFQIVPGQPTLVLDVAHNPHSVAALVQNLDAQGYFPRTHAVFGAMADKDLAPMLERAGALVDCWYFTDLPGTRAAKAADLLAQWQALPQRPGQSASAYPDALAALAAAHAGADPADRIVIFGSFLTVGAVLEHGVPRLAAPHLPT